MILHLSHIFLTEGRTFMIVSFECAASLRPTVQLLGNLLSFYSMQHAQPQAIVVMFVRDADAQPLP